MDQQEIPTHEFIDCRATGNAFWNQVCARHCLLPVQKLKEKSQVEVIDRRGIESGEITSIANVGMKIQNHKEQ
jgi:hypothetical protein